MSISKALLPYIYKKLLWWWLGGYIPSYVKDITSNVVAHHLKPMIWRITWQEAVANCGCLVGHLSVFFADTSAQSSLKWTLRQKILISQDWKGSQPANLPGPKMKVKLPTNWKSSQPAHLLGPKMKPKIFSRTTQNHAAMLCLQYIYNEIIRLAYSF